MNQPINAFNVRTHSAGKHGVQTGLQVPIVLIERRPIFELKAVSHAQSLFPARSSSSHKGSAERWILLMYPTGNESVLFW